MIAKSTVKLDINSVIIKRQLRTSLGDISLLAASIQKYGLIAPIIISRDNVLISGARRLAACREAGLTSITAVKYDIDHDSMQALDIQSDENLCREQLTREEFDRHVRNKKTALASSPRRAARNIWTNFKSLLGIRE